MKRTPLRRGKPLVRKALERTIGTPERRTAMRQASKRGRAKTAAYMPLRNAVLERDGHCVLCPATTDLDVHHRKLRSRGGEDAHENLVTLCRFHHNVVHRSPAWATAVGLMVPAGFDPMDWPVLLDAGRAYWPAASMLWQVPDGHGDWCARAPHPDQHKEPAPWLSA